MNFHTTPAQARRRTGLFTRLLSPAALLAALFLAAPALADGPAGAFDPSAGRPLPTSRVVQDRDLAMLKSMGGRPRTLTDEVVHRPFWKAEVYPVLRGAPNARHEILVLLDFGNPASRPLWRAVYDATSKLPPDAVKVVLFGNSRELYGTDLVGMASWAARERKGQAMDYVSWALARWDEVKQLQKKAGRVKNFRHEYDAVAGPKDYPMTFMAMARFKPPVPGDQQSAVAKYAYEAGNINLFQTTEVCAFYGVGRLPALVVDGRVYGEMTADRLRGMLR